MSSFLEKKFKIIVISLLVLFYIIFKIVVGSVEIETSHILKNPMYKLYIDNNFISITANIKEKTTIIPFTVYRVKNEVYFYGDEINHINLNSSFDLKITGYNCYSNSNLNGQVPCFANEDNKYTDEIDNIIFDDMTIYNTMLKGWNDDNKIYDGKYNSNIKEIINEKGNYTIVINLHHGKIKTTLEIILVVE